MPSTDRAQLAACGMHLAVVEIASHRVPVAARCPVRRNYLRIEALVLGHNDLRVAWPARSHPCAATKSWGRALSIKQKAVLNMSRYFFDVKNGHRLVDSAGLDCSDDEEAISSAQTIARLIAREAPTGAERKVAVVDDEGREVGTVPVEDDKK